MERLLNDRADKIVVVDHHQHPIGWLRSLEIFALDLGLTAPTANSYLNELTQSLPTLPSHYDLEWVYRHYASEGTPETIAIVDDNGVYLGLLDQVKLWRLLAVELGVRPTSPPSDPSFSFTPSPHSEHLNPVEVLAQLLNYLPLPLMVQTESGQLLAQNQVWQERIGMVPNIQQCLQHDPRDRSASGDGQTRDRTISMLSPQVVSSSTSMAAEDDRDRLNSPRFSLCHIAHQTENSYTVLCPVDEGGDRMWQFSLVSLSQMQPQGTPDSDRWWLLLAQDHTEQQRVGRELAAKNADLVNLNRLKDEFLACISHELKTPLTSILGLSSLLKDQSLGAMSDRQTRYAHLIYQSSRHLMLIVNDILDLTRIETGQLELMLEPVNLQMVCHRAYEQVTQSYYSDGDTVPDDLTSAAAQHPPVIIDIQTGQPHIVADEMRLRQMLCNLLSNAVKFTESSGEVGLRVEDWGHWLAFTVWDTGMGIPPDKQHLIFQKFQQLEHPLTRRFEGTGLGLVLTQRLARLHGGEVTFTSGEGEGSQFTILLPVVPPQVDQQFRAPETETRINPRKRSPNHNRLMLVMASVPQLIDDLTHKLSNLGYKVAIARSGTEALEKARQLQPAMVFLDPVLPQLSGWDVMTLLKSDEDTGHIPIVAMTTQSTSQRTAAAGVDGFLTVPIDPTALSQLLGQLVTTTPSTQECYPHLTILHLVAPNAFMDSLLRPTAIGLSDMDPASIDFNHLLHPYNCRVLEVDDVEQADILSRVWKPDVVLLSDSVESSNTYLSHISRCPYLSTLPMITLTPELTQAANQHPQLSIFPCLAPAAMVDAVNHGYRIPALLEAIRVAIHFYWTPNILVANLASDTTDTPLQSVLSYLQRAGITGTSVRSQQALTEVKQAIHDQSIDLLLLCVDALTVNPALVSLLQVLEQANIRPPILVWFSSVSPLTLIGDTEVAVETQIMVRRLHDIGAHILPISASVEDMIDYIQDILGQTPHR
jgi:signal transduction histidine kinase/ActR/RegA family two-component response regulator